MTTYNIGDKVHVEFDAIVVDLATTSAGRLFTYTLRETDPGGPINYVYLHEGNAEVINQEPASWPPVAGDIWEVDGVEYYVRAYVFEGEDRIIVCPFIEDGNTHAYYRIDAFKALRPALVRRRLTFSEMMFDTMSAYGSRLT